MKNLLIGSRALEYWSTDFKCKPNADWDIISLHEIKDDTKRIEHHAFNALGSSDLQRYASEHTIKIAGQVVHIVNPIGLAIIKRSHLWRDLSFQKHITHYHKHLAKYRAYFKEVDELILENRTKLTMAAYPQGHPSLKKSVKDFFDDYVEKKYNHDYLHELVAYHDKPLYTQLQRDSSSAWCDKDLWDKLSTADKIKCVSEEAQVIAIERFLVPSNWNYAPRHAYLKALDKVCTTLCSGWFRDFAIDNYPEIFNLCDTIKFDNIRKELEHGTN
jgi:hypothetical protein